MQKQLYRPGLAVALLASALVVLPFSLLFRFAQQKGRHPLYVARLLMFLSAAAFFSMPVLLAETNVIHLVSWNWRTLGFGSAVAGFIIFSGALFLVMVRNFKRPVPVISKLYLFSGGLAGILLSASLLGWGIFGYAAWAF